MTKLKNVGVGLLALIAIFIVASAAYYGGNHLLANDAAAPSTTVAPCKKLGEAHDVTLHNNTAMPDHISAKLCDTLTFTNQDACARLLAFGPHDDHQAYDGVTEKILDQEQSLTIILNKAGTYYFHDHINDIIKGDFTVR